MDENYAGLNKYTIPKKNRGTVTGNVLREVSPDSREVQHLKNDLQRYRSKQDTELFTDTKLFRIYLVENPKLEEEYVAKKFSLKSAGRTPKETSEQLGFLGQDDKEAMKSICEEGLVASRGPNVLGDSSTGVYLWRHPDLCVNALMEDTSGDKSGYLIIFRLIKGRVKSVLPRADETAVLEPTPNYDCHVSRVLSREQQLDVPETSQIYVFDYDEEDALPRTRPRQCLPLAVIEFSLKGEKCEISNCGENCTPSKPSCSQEKENLLPIPTSPAISLSHIIWSGFMCNKDRIDIGGVRLLSGHSFRLPLDLLMNVTRKTSFEKVIRFLPGDISDALEFTVTFRHLSFDAFAIEPVEIRSTRNIQKLARGLARNVLSFGVVLCDVSTRIYLLPSCELAVHLGFCKSVQPWKLFGILLKDQRRKSLLEKLHGLDGNHISEKMRKFPEYFSNPDKNNNSKTVSATIYEPFCSPSSRNPWGNDMSNVCATQNNLSDQQQQFTGQLKANYSGLNNFETTPTYGLPVPKPSFFKEPPTTEEVHFKNFTEKANTYQTPLDYSPKMEYNYDPSFFNPQRNSESQEMLPEWGYNSVISSAPNKTQLDMFSQPGYNNSTHIGNMAPSFRENPQKPYFQNDGDYKGHPFNHELSQMKNRGTVSKWFQYDTTATTQPKANFVKMSDCCIPVPATTTGSMAPEDPRFVKPSRRLEDFKDTYKTQDKTLISNDSEVKATGSVPPKFDTSHNLFPFSALTPGAKNTRKMNDTKRENKVDEPSKATTYPAQRSHGTKHSQTKACDPVPTKPTLFPFNALMPSSNRMKNTSRTNWEDKVEESSTPTKHPTRQHNQMKEVISSGNAYSSTTETEVSQRTSHYVSSVVLDPRLRKRDFKSEVVEVEYEHFKSMIEKLRQMVAKTKGEKEKKQVVDRIRETLMNLVANFNVVQKNTRSLSNDYLAKLAKELQDLNISLLPTETVLNILGVFLELSQPNARQRDIFNLPKKMKSEPVLDISMKSPRPPDQKVPKVQHSINAGPELKSQNSDITPSKLQPNSVVPVVNTTESEQPPNTDQQSAENCPPIHTISEQISSPSPELKIAGIPKNEPQRASSTSDLPKSEGEIATADRQVVHEAVSENAKTVFLPRQLHPSIVIPSVKPKGRPRPRARAKARARARSRGGFGVNLHHVVPPPPPPMFPSKPISPPPPPPTTPPPPVSPPPAPPPPPPPSPRWQPKVEWLTHFQKSTDNVSPSLNILPTTSHVPGSSWVSYDSFYETFNSTIVPLPFVDSFAYFRAGNI